uniref:ABC transporter permease n=1 Tax=Eiseniibacteriota bacterium TaxID=2212470 RepID=A0A832MIZ0_UNCEI
MPERRMDWWPVAAWEMRRMLTRADFVISVLLMPLLVLGAGLATRLIVERSNAKPLRIAVAEAQPSGALVPVAPPPLARVVWAAPGGDTLTRAGLAAAVRARALEGAVILPGPLAAADSADVVVRRARPAWEAEVLGHLSAVGRRARAADAGLDSAALARLDARLAAREQVVTPGGRVSRADRATALALMLLTLATVFTIGAYMGIGITGEKQARSTEVILSAVSAQSWMDGKIAGYTAIGVLQVVLWAASAAVIALFLSFPLSANASPALLAASLSLFVAGLCLYAALYGTIYATIKDLQSSSSFQAYLFFIPFLPLMFMEGVMRSPDAGWVVALSHVPFFAPFLLPMRMTLGAVAPWEVPLALALCAAAAWLLRGVAGHAMRIGMLMYGKDVSLPELARWARER